MKQRSKEKAGFQVTRSRREGKAKAKGNAPFHHNRENLSTRSISEFRGRARQKQQLAKKKNEKTGKGAEDFEKGNREPCQSGDWEKAKWVNTS